MTAPSPPLLSRLHPPGSLELVALPGRALVRPENPLDVRFGLLDRALPDLIS